MGVHVGGLKLNSRCMVNACVHVHMVTGLLGEFH